MAQADGELDLAQIESLVDQISELKKQQKHVVLVTSGAMGAGLQLNKFESIKDKLIRRQMLAAIGQSRLIELYTKYFKKHGITVAQALLSRSDFSNREKYLNIKHVLTNLLDSNIVPIINENDVVSTEELSFGDNDILGAYTSALIKADKYVVLTTVDGLCDKDPSEKDAKLIEKVERVDDRILALCSKSKSSLGMGGMQSKIEAAKIATELGIETIIANGKTQKVPNIIKGEFKGTTFRPRIK